MSRSFIAKQRFWIQILSKITNKMGATLTADGRPTSFKVSRPNRQGRFFSRHGKVKRKLQETFALEVKTEDSWEPIEQACSVRIVFRFRRPQSHFKKDGNLRQGSPNFVVKRPDIDNLAKLVLDSLQPLILRNDKYTGSGACGDTSPWEGMVPGQESVPGVVERKAKRRFAEA